MPAWSYFSRPTNLAFHDLTRDLKPPKNLRSLLGLSLKFIPNPRYNVPWKAYKTIILPRFDTDLRVKTFFATENPVDDGSQNYNPRMYIRSGWRPPEHIAPTPKEIPRRLNTFENQLHSLVKKQSCGSNLLPNQRLALRSLRNQDIFLVVQCDKNLGPAVIEKSRYIEMAFRDHLSDKKTYMRLTNKEAESKADLLKRWITSWIHKHRKLLLRSERKFMEHHLSENKDPFATFYITMKVHKPPPLVSRPIVSCSGSLLQALGIWVDDKLQITARAQRSYFKSSFVLKQKLQNLDLPAGALLFTADAVSMYTNIPTHRALMFIGKYLRRGLFPDIPVEALMEALKLVMCNNIFTFGDTTWKQLTGTAMGTPPAPPWATLYYALHEDTFVPKYKNLFYYKRFIDDVIGIWVPSPDSHQKWLELSVEMNSDLFGLEWEINTPTTCIDFMDLTISIVGTAIHTTLYEKPHNLHLYIPPSSCHPPGLLPGMVHGGIHRFYTLCTHNADIQAKIQAFYMKLLRRGYSRQTIRSLFREAISKARAYIANPPDPSATPQPTDRNQMIFHLRYHPRNPSSKALQHAWYSTVSEPPYTKPLADIKNYGGIKIGISRMTIAYSRPNNLGNILSYRKLKPNGPPVSSFCD